MQKKSVFKGQDKWKIFILIVLTFSAGFHMVQALAEHSVWDGALAVMLIVASLSMHGLVTKVRVGLVVGGFIAGLGLGVLVI
ncbi:MAG: hypothetical protein ACLFP9_06880 [Desulfonatronovibrio sp.]